jgi:integrase/recombinase XerC
MDALLAVFEESQKLRSTEGYAHHLRLVLEEFCKFASIDGPRQIAPADIEAFLRHAADRGLSLQTQHHHLDALRTFCRWACRRGILRGDPTDGVELAKMDDPLPVYLSAPELAQCLDLARRHGIFCEVAVIAYTGIRLNEARLLEWRDVDLAGRWLLVRKTKSHKARRCWLHPVAMAALEEQQKKLAALGGSWSYVFPAIRRRQHRYTPASNRPRRKKTWSASFFPIRDAMPAFRRLKAGQTNRGFHQLRHTFASLLVQRGVDIHKVAKWIGDSVATTERFYAHLAPGYDSEIEKL